PWHDRKSTHGQQQRLTPTITPPNTPPQQSLRHRRRQRQRQSTSRPHHVASRIERALNQQKRGRAEHPSPKRKLANKPRVLRVQCKPLRPVPKRRPPRRKLRHAPTRNRRPCCRKLRHQDAPRHPVHRQMMDHHKQTASIRPAGIEPTRLHQPPNHRRKPPPRPPPMPKHARPPPPTIKIPH